MDALLRALPKLISAAGGGAEVTEAAARIAWRRVAGEPLRRHAVLFRLFRTMLVIAVSDAIWQKQLVPLSAQLLSRLNAVLGRGTVTFIEFRIDPETVARERGNADSVATITAEQAIGAVPLELHAAANAIADEALRRRFLLVAGASILRRDVTGG
jgi:hypothetical protein